MSYDTHDILAHISNYGTYEVVDLLQKNNLSACCEAVVRRQVDGATLLHLTERDLIQWKLDLTKPLRCSLWRFVEDLNLNPGRYFAEESRPSSPFSEEDAQIDDSDADAWCTDWEGDEVPSTTRREDRYDFSEMNIRTNSQIGSPLSTGNSRKISPNRMEREEENENIYANGDEIERNPSPDPESDYRFTSLRRRLEEGLQPHPNNKPIVCPKPPISTRPRFILPGLKGGPGSSNPKHNLDPTTKTVPQVRHPKPLELTRPLPKPPQTKPEIGGQSSSSDEDDRPTSNGPNRITNNPRPPTGNSGKPPLEPLDRRVVSLPRPLPVPPFGTVDTNKRFPDTFPHTKRSPQVDHQVDRQLERRPSSRPLPQAPGRNFDVPSSYTDQPWFHNVGRDQAIALIEGGTSKFSTTPPNGYFLVRPSNASPTQPWTLVLWYKNKVYNIAVRQRPDSRFALGTVKQKEQSFAALEDLINFCKREEIPLTSTTGEQVGLTRLTESPPRRNN